MGLVISSKVFKVFKSYIVLFPKAFLSWILWFKVIVMCFCHFEHFGVQIILGNICISLYE